MPGTKRSLLKRLLIAVGMVIGIAVGGTLLLFLALCVVCVVAQRGREISTVSQGDYIVRVIYYAGGMGTTNRITVKATGGDLGTQRLVKSIGGDSVSVRFLDSTRVEVKLLNKFYLDGISRFYWHVMDSAVFDLSREVQTRQVGNPAAG